MLHNRWIICVLGHTQMPALQKHVCVHSRMQRPKVTGYNADFHLYALQQTTKLEKQRKRASAFPQRKYAVKA